MYTLRIRLSLIPAPLLIAFMLLFAGHSYAANTKQDPNEIPSLGNSSSSLVSIEQERVLGQAWLRALRRHTNTYQNVLVKEYMTNLVYTLAPNSGVIDRDFTIIIMDNPDLNAFAVPGSIIGVNAGLFFHAVSEQEFASVIAHELAHLSQRHYARQLEQRQSSAPLTLAGILASVVLAATAGNDAGIAALASTQALAADQQLRFSRKNEQEADRLGIAIMQQSNFDPRAMPSMFERMYRKTRLQSETLPEYLSTHPLSETRISDTRGRANQYPVKTYRDNLEFHLSKNMIISDYAESARAAIEHFRHIIEKGNTTQITAAKFGLAYASIDSDSKQAAEQLSKLVSLHPNKISLNVTLARALQKSGEGSKAIELLEKQLKRNPDNYSISMTLAESYLDNNQTLEAERTLKQLVKRHSVDPQVWYLLAEINGLAGNIVDLHQARAEYFYLTNQLVKAIDQLSLAIKKNSNELNELKIQSRLDELYKIKKNPLF
jgi:beta-barrel assembly-enhancing protease